MVRELAQGIKGGGGGRFLVPLWQDTSGIPSALKS